MSAIRRERKRTVLASAPAEIVLPKPQTGPADLPPEAQPEAEHAFDATVPKLPPGTKNRKITKPTLEALKARGKRLNRRNAEKVDLPLRVDPDTYLALIELGEEYNASVAEVSRQCLKDGIRKYREFNSPYAPNPFRDLTPLRAYADIIPHVGKDQPNTGDFAPTEIGKRRRMLIAQELTAEIPELDENALAGMPAEWSKFMPQTGTLTKPGEPMEFDPLAPVVAEEELTPLGDVPSGYRDDE